MRWFRTLALILAECKEIKQKEDRIMAALDDLTAAVAKMTQAVADAVTDIKTLADEVAAAAQNQDGPAIEDAVGKLNALADTLEAAAKPVEPAA